MMTIKEFAALCGCNAQTLRYYDKIDLLKPVQVDPWSAYRYYAQKQALDFVKIKNLQAADFSISEIKELLTKSDQLVYEAFNRKIAEQTDKLERIKKIQQSYLAEMNTMEKLINKLCAHLLEKRSDLETLQELGLTEADAPKIVELLRVYMTARTQRLSAEPREVSVVINDKLYRGTDAVTTVLFKVDRNNPPDTLNLEDTVIEEEYVPDPETKETVWEKSGWHRIADILDEIPPLEAGNSYTLSFHLKDENHPGTVSFPLFIIGAMLLRGYGSEVGISCALESTRDGENHFSLLRHL